MKNFMKKIYKTPAIRVFSVISIILFVIWLILLTRQDISKSQSYLFFNSVIPFCDTYGDFNNPIKYVKDYFAFEYLNENMKMWSCYTPGAFLFYKFFAILTNKIECIGNAYIFYGSMFMTTVTMLLVLLISKCLKTDTNIDKVLFSVAFLTSGIFLFSYERANILLLALLLSSFFIFNYDSKNKLLKELSLISLALAFVIKISPAILGLLLIYKKDYKSAFKAVFYSVFLFIIPVIAYPRGLEILLTFKENIGLLSKNIIYTESLQSLPVGKSIFQVCLLTFSDIPLTRGFISFLFKVSSYITYILCGIGLLCTFFYNTLWRKVLMLILCIMLIPAVNSFYVLIYLLPVMILFFNEKNHSKADYLYIIYFIIIFTPLQIVNVSLNKNYSLVLINFTVIIILLEQIIYSIRAFYQNNGIQMIKDFINKQKNLLNCYLKNPKQKKAFNFEILKNTVCVFLSLIILSIGALLYQNNYKHYSFQNSKSNGVTVLSDQPVSLSKDYVIKGEIDFTPQETYKYENIFQTADVNQGIRAEISPDNIFSLIYSDKKGELKGILGEQLQPNTTYKLIFQITPVTVSSILKEKTDGKFWNIKGDAIVADSIFPMAIQRIISGSGFSEERNFSGTIDNFELNIKSGKKTSALVFFTLLFTLLPLFAALYFNRIRKIKIF